VELKVNKLFTSAKNMSESTKDFIEQEKELYADVMNAQDDMEPVMVNKISKYICKVLTVCYRGRYEHIQLKERGSHQPQQQGSFLKPGGVSEERNRCG
jgi:hypothetical protein